MRSLRLEEPEWTSGAEDAIIQHVAGVTNDRALFA